jgi:diguanylate cyclase (GGDEF)-like protein
MDVSPPILVVDDDIVTRSVIEKYLHKAGFEVTCAANGREALSLLMQNPIRIVVTDWMMPEIDGPQLCQLIREKQIDHYIFIILVTSRDSKKDIVLGLEAGADDYLTKPIHPAELIARIKTCIRILELEQSLKEANNEIRLLSITDALTGTFNRSYLNERFDQELHRAQRYKHDLSILIADIDFFKKVNDTHGHQNGDEVLKQFAKCLSVQLREEVDWVVRYGGEEFLIVLTETDCQAARLVAERLRRSVEKLAIQLIANYKAIQITASFGGVGVQFSKNFKSAVTLDQLIYQADEQLYLSKNQGRNKVNLIEFVPVS